jgi:hypothetical protein
MSHTADIQEQFSSAPHSITVPINPEFLYEVNDYVHRHDNLSARKLNVKSTVARCIGAGCWTLCSFA